MSQLLLSRPVIFFVYFVERWLLSSLFLFLAYEHIATLRFLAVLHASRAFIPAALIARDGSFLDGVHFEDFARYTLLAAFNALCGVFLLISRRPKRHPSRAVEVAVPFGATFSYLIFNQQVPLPLWMTAPFVSAEWSASLGGAGVALSILGLTIAGYSLMWLGRSLGIVVTVRKLVLGGPYRAMRHPMYFGYLFMLTGLFLTACNFRMGVLASGAVALLVWRARLEEKFLCEASPEYAEWMRRTPFLLPWTGRWGRAETLAPATAAGQS